MHPAPLTPSLSLTPLPSCALCCPPQALLLGMDAVSQEPFLVLLGELSETAEVSVSQMTKVGGSWWVLVGGWPGQPCPCVLPICVKKPGSAALPAPTQAAQQNSSPACPPAGLLRSTVACLTLPA
jgi:hypothetical protein